MSRSLFGVQRWQWNHWWARLGQDSDVPVRRNGAAPSNFDRVEPSRSRDAAFESFGKGKGDGFGGKGDAFGKGNWVEFSATFSMLQWSNSNQLHITIPFQICPFFPVSCLLFFFETWPRPRQRWEGQGQGQGGSWCPTQGATQFWAFGPLSFGGQRQEWDPLKVHCAGRGPQTGHQVALVRLRQAKWGAEDDPHLQKCGFQKTWQNVCFTFWSLGCWPLACKDPMDTNGLQVFNTF